MTRTNEPERSAEEIEGPKFTSIEICAGAGGQAIGLHQAGFGHLALVEIDKHAVETLGLNIDDHEVWAWEREHCDVLSADVKEFEPYRDLRKGADLLKQDDLDLLAGGVPCPPFSHAGKQLGKDDERDLFPRMLELVDTLKPRAVMIENVRGIMDPKFSDYRDLIRAKLQGGTYRGDDGQLVSEKGLGYTVSKWDVLEASDFGVPQLRPRAVLVAFRDDVIKDLKYEWPTATHEDPVSVAVALEPSMRERYGQYFTGVHAERAHKTFDRWLQKATDRDVELMGRGGGIAPTLVGGSKKHGGADLGPSRAKAAWKLLGVSGLGVANDTETCAKKQTEDRDLFGPDGPMLTVRQAAIIQGFPAEWDFAGGKTAQYRQVGNAFPPPVAKAVGRSIIDVLKAARERDRKR
ncbi:MULTISPECIES: DNA cytosine methyltransferase [unclassified Streptomyces]|uniref:DNA cytosine methyltransferase n=1 Tax=unclassified Streptomyces TaxID=2593676 RepID=UPI0022561D69|nr:MULTISPECIES: DNA (cytosine-5-)-methyltransferase [unclassified Streptomyces]MCX4990664.1 DNA (cytosine-5-)-methyltransferase [Streptomyces sp. NBC_00568]MCX5004105.1 DNA (cytosine-5-)-methyltransferase [Streptomyces sp. NBC_00638]